MVGGGLFAAREHRHHVRLPAEHCAGPDFHSAVGPEPRRGGRGLRDLPFQHRGVSLLLRAAVREARQDVRVHQALHVPPIETDCQGCVRRGHPGFHPEPFECDRHDHSQQLYVRVWL